MAVTETYQQGALAITKFTKTGGWAGQASISVQAPYGTLVKIWQNFHESGVDVQYDEQASELAFGIPAGFSSKGKIQKVLETVEDAGITVPTLLARYALYPASVKSQFPSAPETLNETLVLAHLNGAAIAR